MDYGRFLYACVGDEANGMQLTMLSALARRNLDPWAEAEELSRLSADRALTRLAAMLESLPGPISSADRTALAERLIALLPPARANSIWGSNSPDASVAITHAANFRHVQLLLIYVGMVLLGGWLASAGSPAPVPTAAPTTVPSPDAVPHPDDSPRAPPTI